MNTSVFKTKIEQYDFSKDGIKDLKDNSIHGEDWPVVYILSSDKEAYIGETQNAVDRMNQHILNSKRKNLTTISLMLNDSFNKSAILDIENMLITHMHADGKYVLQNGNGGQSKLHNYYQRSQYQGLFADIWKELKKRNLVSKELFEVENSEIFKFSPYKELTNEQYHVVEDLLTIYSEAIKNNTRTDVIVNGGAGTGKSLIAIYFINMIANILNNNFDYSTDEILDEESFFNRTELIKNIKEYGNNKLAFVIAVPSFRSTVKKVFNSIKELRHIDVISPSQAAKCDYDVLIVDEAHRLKRYEKLTNYGVHSKINELLGLCKNATELDWLKIKAKKLLVLFYDNAQSVKESDVRKKDFDEMTSQASIFNLNSQLRVKGGNEYIDFVNKLFTDNPIRYNITKGYDVRIFDDCQEMHNAIKQKDIEYNGLCRMLSGISFNWRKKIRDNKKTTYRKDYDFEIDGIQYCWNDESGTGDFVTNKKNVNKIGCIYTAQGYDFNYAGVILGRDISYNPITKKVEYHIENFNDTYSKSKNNVQNTINNIINAYLVLLTRGIYGTYIYAVDSNLREYIKSLLK